MENRQFTRPFVKIQALNDNFYEGELTEESENQLRAEFEKEAFNRGKECGRYNLTRGLIYRCVSLVVEDEFDTEFTDVEIDEVVDALTEEYSENQFDWDFYDDLTSMRLWNWAVAKLQEILNNRDKYYEVEVRINKTYLVKVKATDECEARRIIREYGVDDAAEDYGDEEDSDYEIYEAEELDYEPECYLEW